jgi:primase-polymerase (primpol)-like protein
MGSNVVSVITPQVKNIKPPAFLRGLQGWLIWRYEASAGSNKLLKVPYYTDGGRRYGEQGGPVDCAKLSSWADASQAAAKRGFEGVGFALLPQWGVTALDFDACVDADGRLPAEIGAIVCTTYAEFSPSGKGIRAFVMGNLGNHKSTAEPGRYGIETFATSGYVTFTGRVLDVVEVCGLEDTVAPASEAVLSLVRQRFGDKKSTVVDANDPWAGFERA